MISAGAALAEGEFPYVLNWKRLVGEPSPDVIAVSGERVLFAGADGTIQSVRRADGLRQWSQRPGGPVGHGLAVDSTRLFLADRWGLIAALQIEDGTSLWSARRVGWGQCYLTVSGNRLLVAGGDGVLYALNATDGSEIWRVRLAVRPTGPPAIAHGSVYAATSDARLLRLDLATGRRLQSTDLDGIPSFVHASGRSVWLSLSGGVEQRDADMTQLWRRRLGTSLVGAPVQLGNVLIGGGTNGFVYGLSVNDGRVLWKFDAGEAIAQVISADGQALVTTEAGSLVAVGQDGATAWQRQIEGVRAAWQADQLYLTSSGHLHAFRRAASAASADTLFRIRTFRGDKAGFGWDHVRDDGESLHYAGYTVSWRHGFVQLHRRSQIDRQSLAPISIRTEKVEATQVVHTDIQRETDSLHVIRRLGATTETWSLPWTDGAIASSALSTWLSRQTSAAAVETVQVVDPDGAGIRPVIAHLDATDEQGIRTATLRYLSPAEDHIPASEDLPFDLLSTIEARLRLAPSASQTRTDIPDLAFSETVVPASEARAWTVPGPPRRLRLQAEIHEPTRLDCLVLALPASLGDPRRLFVQDERQQVTQDSTGWVLQVLRARPVGEGAPVDRLSRRQELRPYLQPSLYVQSTAPEIRALADSLVDGLDADALTVARRLHDWVHDHMVPARTNVRFKSSLEVLQDLRGTCSEYTVLFAALARAAGVPTRIAVGFAVSPGGELVLHTWPQVHVGSWLDIDPSWNAFPVGASHIKTGHGLLHPAHLERLNLTLEWITARADSLEVPAYRSGAEPPYSSSAERLYQAARQADREFDEPSAQAARYELAAMPLHHRSATVLVDLARHHITYDELDKAEWALTRLRRQDPEGAHADAGLFFEARLHQSRGDTATARDRLDDILQRFPDRDHADDALGELARLTEEASGCRQARPYYERLLEQYAASGWASVARSALNRCAELEALLDQRF